MTEIDQQPEANTTPQSGIRGNLPTVIRVTALAALVEGAAISLGPWQKDMLNNLEAPFWMYNPDFTLTGSDHRDVIAGLALVGWGARWLVGTEIYRHAKMRIDRRRQNDEQTP